MALTVNTKDYTLDSTQTPDRNRYHGPAHTMSVKDYLDASRVAAKPTADFDGVARSSLKFTRTVVVNGENQTAIAEATFSIPVGTAEADVDSIRDDLGDALISTVGDNLVLKHDINF